MPRGGEFIRIAQQITDKERNKIPRAPLQRQRVSVDLMPEKGGSLSRRARSRKTAEPQERLGNLPKINILRRICQAEDLCRSYHRPPRAPQRRSYDSPYPHPLDRTNSDPLFTPPAHM